MTCTVHSLFHSYSYWLMVLVLCTRRRQYEKMASSFKTFCWGGREKVYQKNLFQRKIYKRKEKTKWMTFFFEKSISLSLPIRRKSPPICQMFSTKMQEDSSPGFYFYNALLFSSYMSFFLHRIIIHVHKSMRTPS